MQYVAYRKIAEESVDINVQAQSLDKLHIFLSDFINQNRKTLKPRSEVRGILFVFPLIRISEYFRFIFLQNSLLDKMSRSLENLSYFLLLQNALFLLASLFPQNNVNQIDYLIVIL